MNSNIAGFIGVTDQQFELMRAIDRLLADDIKARPKNIDKTYKKLTGKYIQKPNMFAQLRELQKQGFVTKSEGAYQINKAKLKQSLQKKKQKLRNGIDTCDILSKEIDQIFSVGPEKVHLKFISRKELLDLNVKKLKENSYYFRTAHIPAIAYSELSQQINDVKDYADVIKKRCKNNKLKVRYILTLQPKRLFLRALEKLKDKNMAFKEVEKAYNTFIKLLTLPNLELRYLDAAIESFAVIKSDLFATLTLPLRGSPHRIMGAIAIENKEITDAYEDMFNRLWKTSKPLTKKLIKKIAKKELKELRAFMNKK